MKWGELGVHPKFVERGDVESGAPPLCTSRPTCVCTISSEPADNKRGSSVCLLSKCKTNCCKRPYSNIRRPLIVNSINERSSDAPLSSKSVVSPVAKLRWNVMVATSTVSLFQVRIVCHVGKIGVSDWLNPSELHFQPFHSYFGLGTVAQISRHQRRAPGILRA